MTRQGSGKPHSGPPREASRCLSGRKIIKPVFGELYGSRENWL